MLYFAIFCLFRRSFQRKVWRFRQKSISLQQQIPPRLSTMRTTVGLRFLYGYMEEDQLHHLYKSGSTFEQAINLYLFDKELRQLIFKAIQDIEHTNCQNSYKCATQKSSCKRGITYRPDVIHYDYNRRKARFYDSTPRRVLHLLP